MKSLRAVIIEKKNLKARRNEVIDYCLYSKIKKRQIKSFAELDT